MKMYRNIFILVLFAGMLVSGSCTKFKKLPPEPIVDFRSFIMFDSVDLLGNRTKAGKLEFYFQDGDGDIGFMENEFTRQDSANLFMTAFRKSGDTFVEITDSTDLLQAADYRIPYIDRNGQNPLIIGTIEVTFLYLFFNNDDTIMYNFYITDRAGNQSNEESTCEIVFSGAGGCIGGDI